MRTRPMISSIAIVVGLTLSFLTGMALRHVSGNALNTLSGVWNSSAVLTTQTGPIEYEISALIQSNDMMLSMVAETESNAKFAFKLNLEYLEHHDNTFLFSVRERSTIWLEQLRNSDHLDIPVAGHLLQITMLSIDENQVLFLFDLGQEYPFAGVFKKGI